MTAVETVSKLFVYRHADNRNKRKSKITLACFYNKISSLIGVIIFFHTVNFFFKFLLIVKIEKITVFLITQADHL